MLIIDSDDFPTAEIDQAYLDDLAGRVLGHEGVRGPSEISLTVTDDPGIQAINAEYRRIDAPTDVLSFSLLPGRGRPMLPDADGVLRLGDIVISYPRVLAQAQEYGHSPRRELGFLFVHGLLHILGYDHEDDAEASVMEKLEDEILEGTP